MYAEVLKEKDSTTYDHDTQLAFSWLYIVLFHY